MKPNFGELSPNMIELFREGKIVLENNDAELKNRVIIAAWPNAIDDNDFFIGHQPNYRFIHYSRHKRKNNWMGIDSSDMDQNHLPIYKATDFIIPERFCIHVTDENREEVKRIAYACGMDGWKWNDNHGPSFSNNAEPYYHYCSKRGSWDCEPTQITEYPLLSFDHFKLLFDGGAEEKEIEGYICPTDFEGYTIKKGTPFYGSGTHNISNPNFYYPLDEEGKTRSAACMPKEIVETWEPIYKSPEVIITVGSCKIPVHVIPGKRIWVEHRGKEIEIDYGFLNRQSIQFKEIICNMKGGIFFTLTNASFDVSLGDEKLSNVTLEEIQKILKTFNQ